MQELLGRITALDPTASLGIRVIACFDELIVGQVNTHGLLAAAAALAGCPAGLSHRGRITRVSPMGESLPADDSPAAGSAFSTTISDDLAVWIERDGAEQANDAIISERLALAVRIRFADHSTERGVRDMHILVDADADVDQRRAAGLQLGLSATSSYRVIAAPLFAEWSDTVAWPSDVITTAHGTLHVLVAPGDTMSVGATPCGIGTAGSVDALAHSFTAATIALRLCRPPTEPVVCADSLGGLVDMLADSRTGSSNPDVEALDSVMQTPWADATIEAVMASTTLRQAARALGIHHSTMQSRLETIRTSMGFDPLDGFGRARLGIAHLLWRLRHSRVLDLPTKCGSVADSTH